MDPRVLLYYALLLAQVVITFFLFYFSGRLLLTLYTLSPLYKGKVPYVPTRRRQIPIAFELLKINEGDNVIDLGCGNGQFLTYSARRVDANVVGVEWNTILCIVAKVNVFFARKRGTITIRRGDYFDENLNQYDKVFMFHISNQIKKIKPKLERELHVGTKIVSVVFPIESPKLKLLREHGDKYKLFLYERIE